MTNRRMPNASGSCPRRRTRVLSPVVAALATPLLSIALLLAASRPASAYEHRKSTPSFGAQFGYGRIIGGDSFHVPEWPNPDGSLGRDFDLTDVYDTWGPSWHVGLRFVLDRNHAFGAGFDDLRYKRKGGYSDEERLLLPGWVKFTTFHADYFLYFRRRMKITSYVQPFVGLQQRELRYKGSDVSTQEYRLLYGIGAGVEYFVRRSFSVDLGAKLFRLRGGDGTTTAVQPVIGIQVYVI
ncbi:MAG: hypothetical protein ACE15D_05510 [Candidatus Eisenbacteria bacterium]|nr:hypothetical protein [Candidatus Eisenbacteria bacterium]